MSSRIGAIAKPVPTAVLAERCAMRMENSGTAEFGSFDELIERLRSNRRQTLFLLAYHAVDCIEKHEMLRNEADFK